MIDSDVYAVFVGTVLMVALFFAGLAYSGPLVSALAIASLGAAYVGHFTEGFFSTDVDGKWDWLTRPVYWAALAGSLITGSASFIAAVFMIF
jgi:hypothetical protein